MTEREAKGEASAHKTGRRIFEQARELAFPRYPGTPGDRKARRLVARQFEEAGFEVRVEEFSYDLRPAMRLLRAALISAGLLAGTASLLAPRLPGTALALLVAGAAIGAGLLGWSPAAERLYRREGPTRTANVIGVRQAVEPRATWILLAHHDSKSQNLTFPARMGLTLIALLGGACLAGGSVLSVLGAPVPLLGRAAPWGGLAAAVALFGLATLRSGNESPGGVDNAGSVAILFELARRLRLTAPEDVELIVLATGAEEDHMIGAMRWLDRHLPELAGRPIRAINFDGGGSPGRLVMIERFGFGRRFAPHLARLARRVAARQGLRLRGIWMPPAVGIDAVPFAHRGLECLTLSSGALGRATFAVHSARDVAEHLDPETLLRTATLAEAIVLEGARSDAATLRAKGTNRKPEGPPDAPRASRAG